MLIDGIELVEGSGVANLVIPVGTAFPGSPNYGELFYRTDEDIMYIYSTTGSTWVAIAKGASITTHPSDDTIHVTSGQSTLLNALTVNASQLNDVINKVTNSEKGVASGIATLDAGAKIPQAQLPALALTDTFVVIDQTAMLALTAQTGDVAVRTDINKSYILRGANSATLGDWQELLTPTDAVSSVGGNVGVITDANIKTSYENNANTNAFTDVEQTLLGNQSGVNTGDDPNSYVHLDGSVPMTGDMTALNVDAQEITATDISVPSLVIPSIDQQLTAATVVDSVIYDTTQDSDGGQWRFSKKSWFGESVPSGNYLGRFVDETAARVAGTDNDWYQLTTASTFYSLDTGSGQTEIFRAGRSEFPKIVLIVAETDKVVIYDLTDSEPSMWMVFVGAASNALYISSGTVSTVAMLEGVLVSASTSSGTSRINFANDLNNLFHVSDMFSNIGDISERNDALGLVVADTNTNMISNLVNDVAMTVLPNAPIDSVTGLKVPTIAVATDGGISVITDSGDVYDITNGSLAFSNVDFDINNKLTISYSTLYLIQTGGIPTSDIAVSSWLYGGYNSTSTIPNILDGDVSDVSFDSIGSSIGVTLLKENSDTPDNSMVAYTTKDYATGWMVGDIRGCLLADSNVGSIVGSELVTNGDFPTNITGWTDASTGTGSIAWNASGYLDLISLGSGNRGIAKQNFSTVIGETYTIAVESLDTNDCAFLVGSTDGGSDYVSESIATTAGYYAYSFVATSTTCYISMYASNFATVTTSVDNITCRLAVDDRSVKGNGAQVFGTVTKSLIDTNSELVAYSGFSASNYLEQPYTSDLDFASTDFYFSYWLTQDANSLVEYHMFRADYDGSYTGAAILSRTDASGALYFTITDDAFVSRDAITTTNTIDDGQYHFVECFRSGSSIYIYVDGVEWGSSTVVNAVGSLSNTNATLIIGNDAPLSTPLTNGSLALFRASATVPTADQRKHIFETERQMIVGKCLLDGDSNAITALDFNEKRNMLSVVTDWGRTDFDNLTRIDSQVTALGAPSTVSMDGDIRYYGAVNGSNVFIPELDLKAELLGRELEVVEDAEWKDVTYENGWVSYSASYNSAQYRKIGDVVELRGLVKSGTISTVIFNLPVGYRPQKQNVFATSSNDLFGQAYVNSIGEVVANTGSNVWFNLDNISFSVS